MSTIAIYSLKGGVGKTTIAVNLAWSAAIQSSRRTLLWDLDPQAASSFLLSPGADQPRRHP
ncbi:MAG: ParA family protein, partial [Sphingomonas sp.]